MCKSCFEFLCCCFNKDQNKQKKNNKKQENQNMSEYPGTSQTLQETGKRQPYHLYTPYFNNYYESFQNHRINQNNSNNLYNPYLTRQEAQFQNNTHERQNARYQKFIEQLKNDGVNINDYYVYNGLFQQCPSCSLPFSQLDKPHLRFCGHLVCNNNICRKIKCGVPNCKHQKLWIKIQNYWPWQTTASKIKGHYYDFIITYGNMIDNQDIVRNFDQNKTFEQLINTWPAARRFLSTIPQKDQLLTVGSKQSLYQNIKNATIKRMAKVLGFRDNSIGNNKNKIQILNKQLGGIAYLVQNLDMALLKNQSQKD